ncbi:serine protease inhibitor 88Ea-like isoform X1 [Homalodisca vitripennis]|uniref:serine protease inhibitor 88Ea-like isoform X1 n=2 Tax=Homalodisca vitripennis TaxID=197043 RepID=UPI001EEB4D9D|nr:serine protease inhibitor 88Ea-like isoform X1 [Homalodisca vitripennis]
MMLLSIVVLACTVSSTLSQCLTAQDDRQNKGQIAHQELLRSQLDFSLSLFKAVGSQQPSDNVFISPLSIYNALLLAYFVSRGHTEESLHKFLYLPANQDKLDMLLSYRVQRLITSSGEYKSQFNTANRLFVSVDQTVLDCMSFYFNDEIEMVDFSGRGLTQAVDRINNWVAQQTKNNIQNMVSADSINPGSQLILANAAYFKGDWKTQFDERDTRMVSFFVNKDKSVMVPMMYQQETFKHWRSNEAGAEIVDLPYKGSNISLLLLLPDPSREMYPAASLLRRLNTTIVRNIIRESVNPRNDDKVEIRIPKFNVERTLELTGILESLGIGDLFRSTSDLTGLTGGPRIRLNNAIHKAKIQVDERGTEAAAATALTDTRIPGSSFDCDRPFIYLLLDKSGDIDRATLLFAGIYTDPTK